MECAVDFFKVLIKYKMAQKLKTSFMVGDDIGLPHEPSRQLRSADENLLIVPRNKSSSYGDRAFSCAVPSLWNVLPDTRRKIPTDYTLKNV